MSAGASSPQTTERSVAVARGGPDAYSGHYFKGVIMNEKTEAEIIADMDARKKRREQQLEYLAAQLAVVIMKARTATEQKEVAKDVLKYLPDESMEYAKRNLNKWLRKG